jgi:2-C-methyl-D-erythritol 4-phosphate cytidylyltransferase
MDQHWQEQALTPPPAQPKTTLWDSEFENLRRIDRIYLMVSAILVAAGRGTRMGPNVDKLFLDVRGVPVLVHTWRRLELCPCIDEIVLVHRDGMDRVFLDLAQRFGLKKAFRLTPGGAERQDSVWNGLQALSPGAEVVAIQDAARPCTHVELIAETVRVAREIGAAVAAQRVVDTIKESLDGHTVHRTLNRSQLWSVQTPQTFRVPIIREALQEVKRRGLRVTDDTAACELIGHTVRLVESSHPNPKVTRPEDLSIIESLLESSAS